MSRRILILSSDITGRGHKSISDSIVEEFDIFEGEEINVKVIDCFVMTGSFAKMIGKSYGTVTRNAKFIWKMIWDISTNRPEIFIEMTENALREKLLEWIKEFNPDLILSVHPNFNAPMINIMRESKIKIPFVIFLADIISISKMWVDKRADLILCPTEESKGRALSFGIDERKLKVTGFPVRKRFCEKDGHIFWGEKYDPKTQLECLLMSGGEGSTNMKAIAVILMTKFNCKVRIVTGNNTALRKRLESTLVPEYNGRVEVFGFVDNIQELMFISDIAFVRGSPNVMMEAIMCNVPIVITGFLPGQESENSQIIEKYNLGVECYNNKNIEKVMNDLLANGAEKLNSIKVSQREYREPGAAANIARFVIDLIDKQ